MGVVKLLFDEAATLLLHVQFFWVHSLWIQQQECEIPGSRDVLQEVLSLCPVSALENNCLEGWIVVAHNRSFFFKSLRVPIRVVPPSTEFVHQIIPQGASCVGRPAKQIDPLGCLICSSRRVGVRCRGSEKTRARQIDFQIRFTWVTWMAGGVLSEQMICAMCLWQRQVSIINHAYPDCNLSSRVPSSPSRSKSSAIHPFTDPSTASDPAFIDWMQQGSSSCPTHPGVQFGPPPPPHPEFDPLSADCAPDPDATDYALVPMLYNYHGHMCQPTPSLG